MNTEQPTAVVEENTENNHIQPGTILKQKREQAGLSQKQVADRLRLRVAIIEQIERNEFEPDQVATFTRGYLRSYAKVVNADEGEVLAALDATMGTQPPQEQKMKSFSRKTNREKHDNRIMALTWGIVIVIVAISSVWWWQNKQKDALEITNEDEAALVVESESTPLLDTSVDELTAEPSNENSDENAPVSPVAEDSQAANELTPLEASDDLSQNSAETAPLAPVTETQSAQPQADEAVSKPAVSANHLELSFNDECWVQVKDSTGKTLLSGIKRGGETVTLDGKKPYNVILGAPENVSITLASEPVDLSGYTAGKAARFTLP
ncbi:transcriptional regulator [Vibrio panuliri]|uniref:Transcriptional regulator n=1 Tax=Vibrio panuliri TaxID=1381081 RepID=A0A1Q9HP37_9VIBR|nr:cytoskeleton protein RodZ [Vibrio panuliri]OLQ92617.1 transcriptional regulator [Vibrio panuliri]